METLIVKLEVGVIGGKFYFHSDVSLRETQSQILTTGRMFSHNQTNNARNGLIIK